MFRIIKSFAAALLLTLAVGCASSKDDAAQGPSYFAAGIVSKMNTSAVLLDAGEGLTGIVKGEDGSYELTHTISGEERTVTLGASDIDPTITGDPGYRKREGGWSYYLRTRPRGSGMYYELGEWSIARFATDEYQELELNHWSAFVHGTRTATDDMPDMGTASYEGRSRMFAFESALTDGNPTNSFMYVGRATLQANFADGSLEGAIDRLWKGTARGQDAPGSIDGQFSITNGKIDAGGISADLSGFGYAGKVEGAFYGPEAAEAAGTVNGASADNNMVLVGWFGANRE